ncbi:MAG: hypothetical protein IJS45_05375 [Clostridia bacterium]|nr:hypothetical protein [Clostridia bacterium]
MKRIITLAALVGGALCLSSCEVHFFTKTYDMPWWAVVLITVAIVVPILIAGAVFVCRSDYECGKCGKTFRPKWQQAIMSIHIGSDRRFRCPHCGKKSMCRKVDGKGIFQ